MRAWKLRSLIIPIFLALLTAATARAGDSASGYVSFKAGKLAIKHGFLVRGPDEMDPSRMVLRLYLTDQDIAAKLKAAKTLSEADRAMVDGAMVDFGDAPHLGYAVRLNGQRLQYSGGTRPQAFSITTNEPNHLAGKVAIDDTASGGAKVDASFDLTVLNTFTAVR